jgi:anti-sigma-K factor RskA
MLSERDIEAAHPDAFDFVFGNLPAARRAEFNRHLTGCRYCQVVVEEYSEIGGLIQQLPPHVEPPAELEDRIVGAMVAALAGHRAESEPEPQSDAADQGATRAYPIPGRQPPAEPETQVQPRPQPGPPPGPQARPVVTRLPVWRRHPGRLAAVAAAAAAAITGAIAIPLSLLGSGAATAAIPLAATAAAKVSGFGAATGHATARQDASGSWNITLTVHHLKNFGDAKLYQCWYVSTQHRQVASAGTFLVPDSGSGTFSMTSAVDPHDFSKMEITIGPPDNTGALSGTVILSGQTL